MRAVTEETGGLRKRQPLTKNEVALKGNDMVRRELTGSLFSGTNGNFSVCALHQRFFWITACTSLLLGVEKKCLSWDSGWKERLFGVSLALCSQLAAIIW